MRADTIKGPKITLLNLETDELFEVPIRPDALTEQVEVGYSRGQIIGLTHQPLQYVNTGNRKLPSIAFNVDQHFAGEDEDIMQLRHFLMAATVEEDGAGGPARITFVWPGVITFTGVITNLSVTHERFGDEGGVTGYTATVSVEEWVPTRRTAGLYRRGVH